ncbi:MAG: hypothetical protein AB8U53_06730 [Rickettsia aeschlimannii]
MALHHAIKANCSEELIQFLIEHTVDINYRVINQV